MHNKKLSLLPCFMRILNSCVVQHDSILQTGVWRCAPASPAAQLCSTPRIRQEISAALFCSCKLLWRSDECFTPLF